jgi:site-specific recombinase XerD
LRKDAVLALRHWLPERNGHPSDAVFPNAKGSALSRDGLEYLLAKYLATARLTCPSLKTKRISPHVLRHYADHRTMPTGTKAKSLAELSDGVFVNLKLSSRAA